MAGRILGCLLIANPPHQSSGELAEMLCASKGSISAMTRMLIQIGLVERVSFPGDRRDYFCLKLGAWSVLMEQRLKQISAMRQLAERGLKLFGEDNLEQTQRLQEMYDFHSFFEQESPRWIDRWKQKNPREEFRSDSNFE